MNYEDKHFALVLAAVASGLGATEAIDKATRILQQLGYTK